MTTKKRKSDRGHFDIDTIQSDGTKFTYACSDEKGNTTTFTIDRHERTREELVQRLNEANEAHGHGKQKYAELLPEE